MTKKDFFRIVIKLFVFSACIQTFFNVVKNILNVLSSGITSADTFLYSVIINVLVIIVLLFFLRFVVTKPDFIINFFKLDKNFDDDKIVIGDFSSAKLLNLGLFTVGVYFIITSLGSLISNLYLLSGDSSVLQNPYFKDVWSKQELITSIVNIIIGSILVVYRRNIAVYFDK
ncbi:hypothetical protein SAMN05660477_02774 [Soonwooa buanensis]|uniref:Uncharacterized protein n=1 Tax=Soonwooa buanensis TaxID=619805 RepID=A0A1T5GE30_9FLAO|nr:hypothetical protein [Soonwooa buanensis]SKC06675.1 hypothetical protein SAMN05660477_02774 [Soonwooa buanensis]